MKKLLLILFIISCSGTAFAQGNLTTPPEDPDDAENLRIWFPIEKNSTCRVMIDILDQKGKIVRQLVNKMLGKGYHNFYWDKRDDEGKYVEPGQYKFRTEGCNVNRVGEVKVVYKKWERNSRIGLINDRKATQLFIELKKDSALVSIDIYKFDGVLVDKPIIDSIMNKGYHVFIWQPEKHILVGRYKAKVIVGDYQRTFIVRHNRK